MYGFFLPEKILSDTNMLVKFVSAIFYQIFIFHQMIAIQKLWKIIFVSSKKALFVLEIFKFLYICPSLFFALSAIALEIDSRKMLVYDVVNCLNKNLNTHYVWYLEKEIRCDIGTLSIDRAFLWKNHAENVHQKLAPGPFLNFAK